MKSWRIWLLLLLAVLLPVRGAVAAAMPCSVAESGVRTELAGDEAMEHAHAHGHADAHDHGAMSHDGGHTGHDHAASDRCNMCSASCALTLLVSDVPTLAEPLDLAAVKFSELSAPSPSFLSDGQERPPRTI